jgi:hypothetical protein
VRTPTLHITDRNVFKQVEVDREPQFFAFIETVGAKVHPYKISLFPGSIPGEESLTVYYDGIIIAEGDLGSEIPQFHDESGRMGLWGDREFINQVRNSSAEMPGLTLRSWIEYASSKVIPGSPNLILGLLQDPTPLISYYNLTIKLLFQSFWARFGWAQVTLVGYRPYLILGLLTLAAVLGSLVAFFRHRNRIRWDQFLFLGIAMILIWGAALLRGVTSFIDGGYFFPVARYAYPVIIPTMLVLNIGWLEIIHWIEHYFHVRQKYQLWVLISLFVILDFVSIYSIYNFYQEL